MNNLKDIHNGSAAKESLIALFYQDSNEQFCCKSTEKIGNMQIYMKLF